MDPVKTDNEGELTSTMDNVISVPSKDEKSDTSSDATPTSSTDANIRPAASHIALDDPISSTSSDNLEQIKVKMDKGDSASVNTHRVSTDNEADLLDISNITNSEKITEDVEDLVHDLESLLGESTDSFNLTSNLKFGNRDLRPGSGNTSNDTSSVKENSNVEVDDVLHELEELTNDVGSENPSIDVEKDSKEITVEESLPVESTNNALENDLLSDIPEDTLLPVVHSNTEVSASGSTSTSKDGTDYVEKLIVNESSTEGTVSQETFCIQDQDISHSEPKDVLSEKTESSTGGQVSDETLEGLPTKLEDIVTSSEWDPNEKDAQSCKIEKSDVTGSEGVDRINDSLVVHSKETSQQNSDTKIDKKVEIEAKENVQNEKDEKDAKEEVTNEEDEMETNEDVTNENDEMNPKEDVANTKNEIDAKEDETNKKYERDAKEDKSNKKDETDAKEDVTIEKDEMDAKEDVSNAKYEIDSKEDETNKNDETDAKEVETNKKDEQDSKEEVSNKKYEIDAKEVETNKKDEQDSKGEVSNKKYEIDAKEDGTKEKDEIGAKKDERNEKDQIGSKENVRNDKGEIDTKEDDINKEDELDVKEIADKTDVGKECDENKEDCLETNEESENLEKVINKDENCGSIEIESSTKDPLNGNSKAEDNSTREIDNTYSEPSLSSSSKTCEKLVQIVGNDFSTTDKNGENAVTDEEGNVQETHANQFEDKGHTNDTPEQEMEEYSEGTEIIQPCIATKSNIEENKENRNTDDVDNCTKKLPENMETDENPVNSSENEIEHKGTDCSTTECNLTIKNISEAYNNKDAMNDISIDPSKKSSTSIDIEDRCQNENKNQETKKISLAENESSEVIEHITEATDQITESTTEEGFQETSKETEIPVPCKSDQPELKSNEVSDEIVCNFSSSVKEKDDNKNNRTDKLLQPTDSSIEAEKTDTPTREVNKIVESQVTLVEEETKQDVKTEETSSDSFSTKLEHVIESNEEISKVEQDLVMKNEQSISIEKQEGNVTASDDVEMKTVEQLPKREETQSDEIITEEVPKMNDDLDNAAPEESEDDVPKLVLDEDDEHMDHPEADVLDQQKEEQKLDIKEHSERDQITESAQIEKTVESTETEAAIVDENSTKDEASTEKTEDVQQEVIAPESLEIISDHPEEKTILNVESSIGKNENIDEPIKETSQEATKKYSVDTSEKVAKCIESPTETELDNPIVSTKNLERITEPDEQFEEESPEKVEKISAGPCENIISEPIESAETSPDEASTEENSNGVGEPSELASDMLSKDEEFTEEQKPIEESEVAAIERHEEEKSESDLSPAKKTEATSSSMETSEIVVQSLPIERSEETDESIGTSPNENIVKSSVTSKLCENIKESPAANELIESLTTNELEESRAANVCEESQAADKLEEVSEAIKISVEELDESSPIEESEKSTEMFETSKTVEEIIKASDETIEVIGSSTSEITKEVEVAESPEEHLESEEKTRLEIQELTAIEDHKTSTTPEVIEQDETALAVASLEGIDMETNAPALTEKEKKEMEALRQAVESISNTSNEVDQRMEIAESSIDVDQTAQAEQELEPDSVQAIVETEEVTKSSEEENVNQSVEIAQSAIHVDQIVQEEVEPEPVQAVIDEVEETIEEVTKTTEEENVDQSGEITHSAIDVDQIVQEQEVKSEPVPAIIDEVEEVNKTTEEENVDECKEIVQSDIDVDQIVQEQEVKSKSEVTKTTEKEYVDQSVEIAQSAISVDRIVQEEVVEQVQAITDEVEETIEEATKNTEEETGIIEEAEKTVEIHEVLEKVTKTDESVEEQVNSDDEVTKDTNKTEANEIVDEVTEIAENAVKNDNDILENIDAAGKLVENAIEQPNETIEEKRQPDDNVGEMVANKKEIVEVSEADTKDNDLSVTLNETTVVPSKVATNTEANEEILPDSSQSLSDIETDDHIQNDKEKESKSKVNERPRRHKKSSDNKTEELSTTVEIADQEKPYSPKVTIKPIKVPDEEVSTTSTSENEAGKGSLKMTITKQSDKMHSILKVSDVEQNEAVQEQEEPLPKLKIKSKPGEPATPKMSTRSSRQAHQTGNVSQRASSPRITIKPVVKPETLSPLKIKIGLKADETTKKHSPKLNIKPIPKQDEEPKEIAQSPRKVIIKNVGKPPDDEEQAPKITIKPIPKPDLEKETQNVSPKLNIKPIKKPEEEENDVEKISPKITIKPIVKPPEPDSHSDEVEDDSKKRIVLKINKGNLPVKESRKREHPPDDDKAEKLAKITVKFSKEGGHPHIVQQPEEAQQKRPHEEPNHLEKNKKQKTDQHEGNVSTRSKQKEHINEPQTDMKKNNPSEPVPENNDNPKPKQQITDNPGHGVRGKHKESNVNSPIESKRSKLSKQKDNNPDVMKMEDIAEKAVVTSPVTTTEDIANTSVHNPGPEPTTPHPTPVISVSNVSLETSTPITPTLTPPQPRKRGRPRKIPLDQRPGLETPSPQSKTMSTPPTPGSAESGRPKRSCRGQSALDTLGLKPRKPRGSRGRGRPPAGESRAISMKPEKGPRLSQARLKLLQKSLSEAGTLNVISIGTGEDRLLDIEDVLPHSQVEKRIIDIKEEKNEESTSQCEKFPIQGGEKNLKAILQQAIKSKLGDSGIVESENLSLEVKREILEEQLNPGASNNPTSTTQAVVSEGGGVSSSSISPPHKTSEAMLVSDPVPQDASLPKSFGASDDSSLLTLEQSSVLHSAVSSTTGPSEVVLVDEETRMSAETSSRAQTPAKQMVPMDTIEESQSSVLSTATTESGKASSSRPSKAPRLEVQEPEGSVISPDQLAEYYWNGNGPFMLQEQVAHFLGIKSFKRKYPNIKRRMLEMQERDFIRESGIVSEHMCDLGLTAVNSADILDIMYSDFQDKYEEYCKHQRDRQTKELINKQRALSLAASQEKNKADLTENAKQSAAQWNVNFNKTRREQRRACMDLQTYTVHYPKGKLKQYTKGKMGNYPVALVPGQFTDYFKEFTPTEINNLPLNTMCYEPVDYIRPEVSSDSGSDGSDSDSDSSSSSSDSDSSSSSGVDDCKLCKHSPKKVIATPVTK